MRKKRVIVAILILLLAAAGVVYLLWQKSSREVEQPAPTVQQVLPTAAPAETMEVVAPDGDKAFVIGNQIGLISRWLSEGEQVNVLSEEGEYYLIDDENGPLYVEKRYIRMDSEGQYPIWKGYAMKEAVIYADCYMTGEPQDKLKVNAQMNVLADLGACYLVELDNGGRGFMPKAMVSETKLYTGGGGSSDGQDIQLGWHSYEDDGFVITTLSTFMGNAFTPGLGASLADGVEAYRCILSYDEIVFVTERIDENCAVTYNDMAGYIPAKYIRLENDGIYEKWDVFVVEEVPFFADCHGHIQKMIFTLNTPVTVVEEFDDFYLVEFNTELGYVAKASVNIEKYEPPKYSGGGGGGGGPEWTDPVL